MFERAEFNWTPTQGTEGVHGVTISVSDGEATASDLVQITVQAAAADGGMGGDGGVETDGGAQAGGDGGEPKPAADPEEPGPPAASCGCVTTGAAGAEEGAGALILALRLGMRRRRKAVVARDGKQQARNNQGE